MANFCHLKTKITLDFPAWVGYNKLQVEQYDGAVTTELNIVNPTSMCKCRHTQALGSFYTILEVAMNSRYFTSEIKDRLTMPEVLAHYGISVNRQRRIPCPLHGGTDANCGVKEHYIHCFVCEESADVIGFVQKYFGLSFIESITKLNTDFCLALPIGEKIDRRKQIDLARKSFKARQEREKQQSEHNRLKNARESALDEWVRLDIQKREYKPKDENENLHPLFVDALMNLSQAEHNLDCAEMELYLYETRNNCNS